ncbi:hypothetical protein P9112_001635 [Eukaryota sp. TZLM1-RC]
MPSRINNRVLVLGSRGLTHRYRHLMHDLTKLLPHHKSEPKLDKKQPFSSIAEIAESRNCTGALFFEVRKKQDCYLWMSVTPNGPCAKFHVLNVHTMDELKLTGNSLLFSRPILHFDGAFDSTPQYRLLKEMFTHVFRSPKDHHKVKPFVDHVLGFYIVDNKIWFRNFQIVDKTLTNDVITASEVANEAAVSSEVQGRTDMELVEIGPRMVLNPIRIFEGAFSGSTIFKNDSFVTPTQLRSRIKRELVEKYRHKLDHRAKVESKKDEYVVPPGELDGAFKLSDESDDDLSDMSSESD